MVQLQLQLIKGSFDKSEALELISQMVHVKIKYHENKIKESEKEEDIKMREKRIKQLQHEFHELRTQLMSVDQTINIESGIGIA
ncbi:MAG: hypothetical protein ACN4EP_04960 [Sediminibacterium sp.]